MRGYSDCDPMTNIQKGQTVKEIIDAAKLDPQELPAKRIISEDRKEVLRIMGLNKWAA